MKVKLLHKDAKLPKKAYVGDAGFDVYATGDGEVPPLCSIQVKLGIAVEVEPDEVVLVSERSGQAIKSGLTSIGNVIDSNYRGEISAILLNSGPFPYSFKKGDRICQLLVLKLGSQDIEEASELSPSGRGTAAHNSSGS